MKYQSATRVVTALLRFTFFMAALLAVIPPEFALAKVGFRQLTTVYPVAVQRGTRQTVKLRSNFTLDGTYAAFFDTPGIVMTYAETKPIEAPRKGRASVGTPFRFRVRVPRHQQTGVYEFRVATPQAVSSISHLLVTDFPIVEEKQKTNDTIQDAQQVSLPAAICGVCERDEDVDCFQFSGEKGQQMSIEVYAQRVTERIHIMLVRNPIYHMDSILTLIGPSGQIVAQNDNFHGADSFLHCQLPETGQYTIKIRDVRYAGSLKYSYCIEVSDRPSANAVFPLAIQAGTSASGRLVGFGLQDETPLALTSRSDDVCGWTRFRGTTGDQLTNEVPQLISPHQQFVAPDGSDSLETALPIVTPCGISGRLSKPETTQYFSFQADKDQYYLFEVEAHRRGLPLDSVLEVYDEGGKKLAEEDDVRGSPFAGRWTRKDSRLHFKAASAGKHYVAVRDLHGRGGERFVYHLRAEPSGPDFELFGEYYYAMLAPGTRMLWFARVNRLNGFDGPIEMGVSGLPSGVTMTPVTIPAGMNHCALILTADADAPINASLVRVFGKATVARRDGSSEQLVRYGNVTCELQSGGGSSQVRWPCRTQIVGVTKPLDLARVEACPAKIALAPGGRAEITVKITRAAGNSDPVTLALSHLYTTRSSGDQLPPGVTLAADSRTQLSGEETEATLVLQASEQALPVKDLAIAVMARVFITYNISTNYASNPIGLSVGQQTDRTAGCDP